MYPYTNLYKYRGKQPFFHISTKMDPLIRVKTIITSFTQLLDPLTILPGSFQKFRDHMAALRGVKMWLLWAFWGIFSYFLDIMMPGHPATHL